MTTAEVFSIANTMAMPMWLLMMVLPKWKVTRFLIDYKVIPILLSLFYVYYMVSHIQAGGDLDFGNLSAVMSLFTMEMAVMAGWIHYLAFDLLVGMWMLNQNHKLGIHQLLMVPCLFATFMLGPIGFLLFMLIRTLKISKS
ncbi:MAG: ABA4-like family protein [Bacteroidota bacterium]